MPRAKNPIADLAAHRDKLAQLNDKQTQLEREAAEFLGRLMLKAGLDQWEDKVLRLAIARLGKLGADKSLSLLAPSPGKRTVEKGANASLVAAE
mgnify:CR=1 FL=1